MMPSSTTSTTPSRSGIRTDATGTSFIPSSVRSDGSTRKEIRVRPGYRPPEDVEVYKNRTAEAFKNRGKSDNVPGAEPVATTTTAETPKSKNAKRREAARQKAAAVGPAAEWNKFAENAGSDGVGNGESSHETTQTNGQEQQPDEDAEKEKKARNLKKKLRQARELQGKEEQGESLLPEQFAKVLKIQELIRDLEKLGFDAEGGNKAAEEG